MTNIITDMITNPYRLIEGHQLFKKIEYNPGFYVSLLNVVFNKNSNLS